MVESKTDRPAALPTTQVDNDLTIVTEWRFPPGAETGWHRHGFDYVVVPMTSGKLTLESKDGTSQSELTTGQSYFKRAGVEHNVVNDNDSEFVFVEIEFK